MGTFSILAAISEIETIPSWLTCLIVLNNQMDDFASPGEPNYFGVPPAKANFIEPGKIPLSSMSPTMILLSEQPRDETTVASLGKLILVLGASGGPKIITAVLQVILNHLFRGMSLWESVIAPRIHDQLVYHGASVAGLERTPLLGGGTISVSERTRQALEVRGQALLDIDYAGTVQAAAIDLETNERSAVSDIRKGGTPAGY